MHHNGSDDQNIAGKYSMNNYRFHQSISQKSHFFRSNGDRKEVEFWPLTHVIEIIDSFQFISNEVI